MIASKRPGKVPSTIYLLIVPPADSCPHTLGILARRGIEENESCLRYG
jgi:hypothetical protein